MASPPEISFRFRITSPIVITGVSGCSSAKITSLFSSASWSLKRCIQAVRLFDSISCVSSGRVSLQSPQTPTVAFTFLSISDGSMSRCITLACFAYLSNLPVTRSSNRMPTAINTSQSFVNTLGP